MTTKRTSQGTSSKGRAPSRAKASTSTRTSTRTTAGTSKARTRRAPTKPPKDRSVRGGGVQVDTTKARDTGRVSSGSPVSEPTLSNAFVGTDVVGHPFAYSAAALGLSNAPTPDVVAQAAAERVLEAERRRAELGRLDLVNLMSLDLQGGVNRGLVNAGFFAQDMEQGEQTTTVEGPHLGMRREGTGVSYVTRYAPRIKHKGARTSDLVRRVSLSRQLAHYLPPPVQTAYYKLQRLCAMKANPAANNRTTAQRARDIGEAEDALMSALATAAAPVAELVAEGVPVGTLSAADLAVYFLAAVYAATKRQYEVLMALPTIKAVFPETVYNTLAGVYTDFVKSTYSSPSSPMAATGGGIGAGGHAHQEQKFGPLRPFYQDWNVEEWSVQQHEEAMNLDGAPAWTLLDEALAIASAALLVTESKLVAFGERPDQGINAPEQILRGAMYLQTPVDVAFNTNNGVTNYDAAAAFVNGQHADAQWTGALMGDVLTLSSEDYARLGTQFLNSAGGTMSVLAALLMNVPGLKEIRQAREYAPNADELLRLQEIGHPYANWYQGGVRVSGTQYNALTIHRDDPDVVTSVTGFSLQTYDNGLVDGKYNGRQGLSTGAMKIIHRRGFKLAKRIGP
jgi:hypothetical protein